MQWYRKYNCSISYSVLASQSKYKDKIGTMPFPMEGLWWGKDVAVDNFSLVEVSALTFLQCFNTRGPLTTTTTTTVLRPFYRDHLGEPVPEENFWTLWCKGRLPETDTLTTQLGDTPSGLTSAHLHHPPHFLQAGCPSCRPTNSVKALKATSAFIWIREKDSRVFLSDVACTIFIP